MNLTSSLATGIAPPNVSQQESLANSALQQIDRQGRYGESNAFRAITRGVSRKIAACELTYRSREAINYEKAEIQLERYCELLGSWGVDLMPMPASDSYPDCCFVQDTAVVLDEVCVIASMGAAARVGEPSEVERLLAPIREIRGILLPATLDGGDVVQFGKRLFVGLSTRTNARGIAALSKIVEPFGYSVVPVTVNGGLHLTTGCGIINDETVLLNPRWLDASAFKGLRQLHVSEEEPWAANTIRVGNAVCVEAGAPRTLDLVQPYAGSIDTLDISEFRKAEGSLSCLSLIFKEVLAESGDERTWEELVMESPGNKGTTESSLPKYFAKAEAQFASLMEIDELDQKLLSRPWITRDFEKALALALRFAFGSTASSRPHHLFLQRVLYRINRLKFFWYDDLTNYKNERSEYLRGVQHRIEAAWAPWELSQFASHRSSNELGVADALRRRAGEDVAPEPSPEGIYFRDHMGIAGYRTLLQIASLDGLVEASQLSRTLGGVSNEIQAMMTRLLVEEYGGGRLNRKHSSYFTHMLEELDICALPEAHFEVVPWEVLATINHSFLVSEQKRFYLRYVGGLLYTEISVPAAFDHYRLAAERLGMPEKARGYWELHIREDERHGRWMLEHVALPLASMYRSNAAELVLGYDQQKFMSERSGKATAEIVKQADYGEQVTSLNRESRFEAAA